MVPEVRGNCASPRAPESEGFVRGVNRVGPSMKELFERVSGSEAAGEMTRAICSEREQWEPLRAEHTDRAWL